MTIRKRLETFGHVYVEKSS